MATFLTLGRLEDFPKGDMRAFRIAGKQVGIAHIGDAYLAFSNECTHQYAYLTDGFLRDKEIICVRHWATFDLTSGACTEGPGYDDLAVYPTRIAGEELQIEWPEEQPQTAVVKLNR